MVKIKPTILPILIAVVGLALFIESGILNTLMVFLLVGGIPGTSYSIPPTLMLLLMTTALWIVFFRFAAIQNFYTVVKNRASKNQTERKKRTPRRRFGQI